MVIVVEKLIRKKDTNIKGRTKIRLQALGLTCMIKDVGLYDVVFIFENWQTWISRRHKCFMLDLICTISFFGSWQHGIFFIIKDIVSKILKGKRFYGQDRDVWEFLTNPRISKNCSKLLRNWRILKVPSQGKEDN